MSNKGKNKDKTYPHTHIVPFESAQEVWFWFIQAQQARNEGARFTAGLSLTPRPCEPVDILKILDRLYRQRRLMRDHLLILRHYGRRQLAPDPVLVKEAIAYKLWGEAMERIEPVLIQKKIVKEKKKDFFHETNLSCIDIENAKRAAQSSFEGAGR